MKRKKIGTEQRRKVQKEQLIKGQRRKPEVFKIDF